MEFLEPKAAAVKALKAVWPVIDARRTTASWESLDAQNDPGPDAAAGSMHRPLPDEEFDRVLWQPWTFNVRR